MCIRDSAYHVETCQKIFTQLYEQGDIYKGVYKGHYCKPCEAFWTDSQLVDGKCPDCGREVYEAEEEAYFFKTSKYACLLYTSWGEVEQLWGAGAVPYTPSTITSLEGLAARLERVRTLGYALEHEEYEPGLHLSLIHI